MIKRTELMRAHGAAPSCVEASWTVRSEAAALRLQDCGRLWFERTGEEGFTWSPARCRSRWCPSCQNLWREPILEAFSGALPDGKRVTLATFTGGRSVWPRELRGRIAALSRALSRWRRRAKKDGVEGGLYAFEVTEAETGKLHAHVHLTMVYDPSAWWAEADDKSIDSSARQGDLTASLSWLALTWSSALEREAPSLYAELPLWSKAGGGGLLPSMERAREHYFPEFGEVEARRGAVCDIGGRWPKPERRGELLERLGAGEPREVLKETLKYTVKNGGETLSTAAWCEILGAFKGRRRVQGFGCLYGVRAGKEEAETVERSELTGKAAIIETGEPLGVSMLGEVLKAFVWRAEISRVEPERGGSVTWLECDIEGGS